MKQAYRYLSILFILFFRIVNDDGGWGGGLGNL